MLKQEIDYLTIFQGFVIPNGMFIPVLFNNWLLTYPSRSTD